MQYILVDSPKVGRSTRMHCIYRNFDNIYYEFNKYSKRNFRESHKNDLVIRKKSTVLSSK